MENLSTQTETKYQGDITPVVTARLLIEMVVDCPGCDTTIDILSESETNHTDHNEDGALLGQMFPTVGSHDDFECVDIVCTECQTNFSVRELEW